MSDITVEELLESGIHFGHSTSHWNPKMKPYIFGKKSGIYIVNLRETVRGLLRACQHVQKISANNGLILFVGTKKQAKDTIREAAESCGMPFVDQKWLGGTLTNLEVIRQQISNYKTLDARIEDPDGLSGLSVREAAKIRRNHKKLKRNLEGIVGMERLPDAIVIVDTNYEKIAIQEANRVNVPLIALTDTNGNPENITIPVPGNDDAIRSIQIFCNKLVESINEGAKHRKSPEAITDINSEKTENAPAADAKTEAKAEVKAETPAADDKKSDEKEVSAS